MWPTNDDGSIKKLPKPEAVKIEARDKDTGATPLVLAALNGGVEAVECLLAYGANVNAKDSKGNTALAYGAWSTLETCERVVDTLLKNGADPGIVNSEGAAPIHHACQSGKAYIVMMLLDAGASVHVINKAGESPLDVAARYDKLDVVSFLIDHDQSVIQSTRSLREATKTGKYAVAKLLLDFRMDYGAQDPDSGDAALHIAVRFYRTKLVNLLLEYGADPYLPNAAGETPHGMVDAYPRGHPDRQKILDLIDATETKEIRVPESELNQRRQHVAQEATKVHAQVFPLLKVLTRWAEDNLQHRSASTRGHPVTNVLSADPQTFWLAPGIGRQWAVFDFGSSFTINTIILNGVPGKHMPKAFQLEVSPSIKGPWRVVHNSEVAAIGKPIGPGSQLFSQSFTGFLATSQFWKLHIIRNHGAHETRLHGVSFRGVEHGLKKFFVENGLVNYYDDFVAAGINQIKDLPNCSAQHLDQLVALAGHRKKVQLAIDKLQNEKQSIGRLVFAQQPTDFGQLNEVLPPFEVHAGPGLNEEVELEILGDATITGTTKKNLVPNTGGPSTVVFDDIQLAPVGTFLFQVRFTNEQHRDVFVRAARPTEIEPARKKVAIRVLFEDFAPMLDF